MCRMAAATHTSSRTDRRKLMPAMRAWATAIQASHSATMPATSRSPRGICGQPAGPAGGGNRQPPTPSAAPGRPGRQPPLRWPANRPGAHPPRRSAARDRDFTGAGPRGGRAAGGRAVPGPPRVQPHPWLRRHDDGRAGPGARRPARRAAHRGGRHRHHPARRCAGRLRRRCRASRLLPHRQRHQGLHRGHRRRSPARAAERPAHPLLRRRQRPHRAL